jgi:hypothetical protein
MDNDVEGGSPVLSQDLTGRTDENHEKYESGEPVFMLGIEIPPNILSDGYLLHMP